VIGKATSTMQDALDATASEVAARLGDFRETAGTESKHADEVLRATQQTLIAEMQRAMEEATRRFNDTAAAMRATAREVGQELEATRSELQRGVVELPEETRASAAAMRRVVAEQIEALSELNAIVRSQSATHDFEERRQTATPRPQAQAPQQQPRSEAYWQPEQRNEQPRRNNDSGNSDVLGTIAREAQQRAAAPAPRTYAPATPAPQQQQPAQAAPAPAQAQREDGNAGNGGWLRDVLRNATAAKQAGEAERREQQGQQQPGNLNGLTDDIARAMDESAFADAWARYQAGESNVFSRRIYTLGGQGTYDEVRRKLQREADFQRAASAYMVEFEQLLKRAAQGPQPAVETREHLLSDRGKVYTMLAHASGRLS
jgi:hypothetical protein